MMITQSSAGALFSKARRLVVKIGSSLLVNSEGSLSNTAIDRIVDLVVRLKQERREVVVVSSGAVAASRNLITKDFSLKSVKKKILSLPEKQAHSAVGQIYLMEKYRRAFLKKGYLVGQILVSKFSINHRASYLNARNTVHELLSMAAIPIVNENDPLATEEFCFGENDILGSLTCGLIDADLFLILSHVDGVYKKFPTSKSNRKTKFIDNKSDKTREELYSVLADLSSEFISSFAKGTSEHGSGGILAKLEAARLAGKFGVPTLIKNGSRKKLYEHILDDSVGTLILAHAHNRKTVNARKRWLLSNVTPRAVIRIDEGAVAAILKGKSLLPGGVVAVKGKLEEGDICNVVDHKSNIIARGLCNYSQKDLLVIKGQKSSVLANLLGRPSHTEVIHRDNLVLWEYQTS